MRAINHAITGSVLSLAMTVPAVGLPLAFLSHFVLDAIPHYDNTDKFPIGSRQFTLEVVIDALLCVVLVGVLIVFMPDNWFVPSLGAFLAVSPDLTWIPRYLKARATGKDPGPSGVWERFHAAIQWLTWPGGIWIEAAWLLAGILSLSSFL